MDLALFLNSSEMVVLFYAAVFLLIYINREKFEIQAKIIAIYRTNVGIGAMQRLAERAGGLIRAIGLAIIIPAFGLMVTVAYFLLLAVKRLLLNPAAPSEVGLALPGVHIPGSPFSVPLWHGIIAIFVVAAIHEFCHGILATAHKLKVTSTGFFFMGPIPGAFVEPDEKQLRKARHRVQQAVFAAGPISNVVLALFMLLLIATLLPAGLSAVSRGFSAGVSFRGILADYPAAAAQVPANATVSQLNGNDVRTVGMFLEGFKDVKPGDNVTLTAADGTVYSLLAVQNPSFNDSKAGFIGITGIEMRPKNTALAFMLWPIRTLDVGGWFWQLFWWILVISSGIGLMNLLPIGPLDGGRMAQILLHDLFGEKRGDSFWKHISVFFLAVLVLLVFFPIVRAAFHALAAAVV